MGHLGEGDDELLLTSAGCFAAAIKMACDADSRYKGKPAFAVWETNLRETMRRCPPRIAGDYASSS